MKANVSADQVSIPRVFIALLCCLVGTVTSRGETAGEATPAPKTHTLFMGVDFAVERGKDLYPVEGVVGGSLVIIVNGRETRVPLDYGSSKFKLTPTLKLSELSAAVTNLKSDRAYTLGNDPTVQFERGLASSQLQYSDNQSAANQANSQFHWLDPVTAAASSAAGANDPHNTPNPTADLNALLAQQNAQAQIQRTTNGPGSHFQEHGSTLDGEGMFDAMDVSFAVSSPRPLKNPYLVIVAQFHAPKSNPDEVQNWIYARELPDIGQEPVKIQFLQGGFPPGFTIKNVQYHLFDHGTEIATTVAPSRVTLTRDEAFLYAVGDYVGTHKGATLPTKPTMSHLPEEVRMRVAKGEWPDTFFLKVGKDGIATGAFVDEACSKPVEDPYLQSVLRNIRFKPALDKGKPIEAVAPLKLTQLVK